MDFPADTQIGPWGSLGPWDVGGMWGGMYAGGFSSHTFLSSNQAVIAEVFTPYSVTVRGFAWTNGSAVSGNVDCGIYDANRNLIVKTGSTAQAGTSATQSVGVTATPLKPGNYYVAVVMDNTTGTLVMQGSQSTNYYGQFPALGVYAMASAFPLPTTLTLAVPGFGQGFVPMFSALIDASVV